MDAEKRALSCPLAKLLLQLFPHSCSSFSTLYIVRCLTLGFRGILGLLVLSCFWLEVQGMGVPGSALTLNGAQWAGYPKSTGLLSVCGSKGRASALVLVKLFFSPSSCYLRSLPSPATPWGSDSSLCSSRCLIRTLFLFSISPGPLPSGWHWLSVFSGAFICKYLAFWAPSPSGESE